MRRTFARELLDHAIKDKDIMLLVGDLGYGMWDEFRHVLPEQFLNCGASEQSMLDIAVGLAYEGKRVFVYTITPFFYRGFETIRTYIAHENLPIVLVGSGRDTDYAHDGYSHDASDIPSVLGAIQGLKLYFPETKEEIPDVVQTLVETKQPSFISLRR